MINPFKKTTRQRKVTQADLDRNEALRKDGKKVGDIVWFKIKK